MQVKEPGDYRLTEDFQTRGGRSCAWLTKGTIITISQIDFNYDKVFSPSLLDWTCNNMPLEFVEQVKEKTGLGEVHPGHHPTVIGKP